MRYRFYIVDVFSPVPFGGNQLAVVPTAAGITAEGMQSIASEFNFAETAFVLPPIDPEHTCRLRVFTPTAELQFAGHPTIGAACALVRGNHVGTWRDRDLLLEEGIGPVHVRVQEKRSVLDGTLILRAAPDQPEFTESAANMASVLSLQNSEVLDSFFASVGLPFCFVHLRTRAAVDRARLEPSAWSRVLSNAWASNIFLFAGDLSDGAELYARMFAPGLGVKEDPATGSACAALVGALAGRQDPLHKAFSLSILQGVSMGRRSEIQAVARCADGAVTSVSIKGATVPIANGEIEVPSHFILG